MIELVVEKVDEIYLPLLLQTETELYFCGQDELYVELEKYINYEIAVSYFNGLDDVKDLSHEIIESITPLPNDFSVKFRDKKPKDTKKK